MQSVWLLFTAEINDSCTIHDNNFWVLWLQIKSEEDFQCEQDDVLSSAWQQSSPQDKLLHYSKFPSPGACSDFD